jgi:hypothetical protein
MSKLPHPSGQGQWIDLIAFLSVLSLAVILMAFGHVTAGSLAIVSTALAGLYTAFKRPHGPEGARSPDQAEGEKIDEPSSPESDATHNEPSAR